MTRSAPRRGDAILVTISKNLIFVAAFVSVIPVPSASLGSARVSDSRPPNVVLILVDDMGWRDVGFAGNDFVETPNIDRIAAEGVQFAQAYASAPNCAPTRACLMTGQYTPRHGVYTVVDPRHEPGQPWHRILAAESRAALDPDAVTIAEALQSKGYATACIGMWNLGRGRKGPTSPTGQGFDLYRQPRDYGFEQDAYFDEDGNYLTDVLTEAAVAFIQQHQEAPFFLYLATHAVHAPFDPKPELVEKYRRKAVRAGLREVDPIYAAMIEALDKNVGRLLSLVESLDLSGNTVVVFTSDNGGTPQYVAPLRGSKGSLYEGGIRVPCAIWWAGIRQPGRVSNEPVLSMDFYPTLLELAGIPRSENHLVDGTSLVPILADTGNLDRTALFWHFPCYIGRGRPSSAVRMGEWMLIENFEDRSFELFDLHTDFAQANNLADVLPGQLRIMQEALAAWQQDTGAPIATTRNTSFDPSLRAKKGVPRPVNNARGER